MSEDILQNNHRSEDKEVIHEGEVCLLENVEISDMLQCKGQCLARLLHAGTGDWFLEMGMLRRLRRRLKGGETG